MSNAKITVKINDTEIDPSQVIFHFQSDPFPGGLQFSATIPRSFINSKIWKHARFESCVLPKEDKARDYFFWLANIFSHHRNDGTAIADFVLNNISEMQVNDGTIEFTGACSPFVRGHNNTAK